MTRAMTQDAGTPPPLKPATTARDLREVRRKEALKANMGRRKAQARARGVAADEAEGTGTNPGPEGE